MDDNGTNQIDMVNVVFTGNSAYSLYGALGGAILNMGDLDLTTTNATFTGNTAYGPFSYGGAVCNGECSPAFNNCIFWNNSAADNKEIYNPEYSNSNPIFTACDVEGSVAGLGTDGGGNIDQDPLFSVVPDSGDGDWTTWADNSYGSLILQAGSPAIDTGQGGLLPADTEDLDSDGNTTEAVPLDIEGNARIQEAGVDMGAYEYQ